MLAACVLAATLLGQASYRLPWEDGKTFPITQGNGGATSHTGYGQYAFDIGMPEGTKVCAARGGKVAEVKEDIVRGGTGGGNQIRIDHGDGTFGLYFHLKHQGALVEVGDVILQGDLIGLSGATGNVTGPHLHFQVDKGGTSIPVSFEDVEADGGVPQGGKSYASKNTPGIPAETKDKLAALARAARLAEQEGAWGVAYLAHKRFAEEKLKVPYSPQEDARRRMEEILMKAEEAARSDDPSELFRARLAFEGAPIPALVEALHAARNHAAYPEAKARSWSWERFYKGVKDEVEGKLGPARTHYKNILSNKPPDDLRPRAEARLAAVEARMQELLKKR